MTATDELRRMLDERGVKWTNPNSCLREEKTNWVANGFDYEALEDPYGTLILSAMHQDSLTPEQAVAATVRRGTCKVESSVVIEFDTLISPDFFEFEMGCGSRFRWSDNEPPDYCPGCGRKVVHGGS